MDAVCRFFHATRNARHQQARGQLIKDGVQTGKGHCAKESAPPIVIVVHE